MPSHPVDVHVGARMRQRRALVGMNQTALGKAVALTVQQIQKYERGSNRISSSRLFEFAVVLDVPVAYFFDDMPASVSAIRLKLGRGRNDLREPPLQGRDSLIRRETIELVYAYYKVRAPRVRADIAKVIKAIAAGGSSSKAKKAK